MSLKAGIHLGNITLLAADKNEMRLDRDTRVSGHDQVEKILMQQGGVLLLRANSMRKLFTWTLASYLFTLL